MPVTKSRPPSLRHEKRHWENGAHVVVGVDEVGRGAWAGPLTIGAAVVPPDRRVNRVRDSKMLSEAQREGLFDRIADWCDAWAVGHASAAECDALGMSEAQRLAARRAVDGLGVGVDVVLMDGKWDFMAGQVDTTETIVKGDAVCLSIAAASILAKVTRDRMMRAAAEDHPPYGFDGNKGYPAPDHITALNGYGPSAIHRRSWVFMDKLPWPSCHRSHGEPRQTSLFDAGAIT